MAEASIIVAVRVRPFSEKESAQLAPQQGALPFLGDGGLGASPAKAPPPVAGLRTRFLRPIVHPVDDKVLIFDPPDNNPLSRLYNNTQANYLAHGQKRAKDVRYAFDRVFNESATQRDIFEGTTNSLLDGVLNGFNATVFAYGATGCGKTHTISGTPEDPGLIFLTMQELYQRIADNRSESEVQLRLSYLEIYNESIRDLLSETPTPAGRGLPLCEDEANKMSVVGITEHSPTSPEEVVAMIQEGNARRTMSPTEANAVSSRSHAVLQINVTQRPRAGDVSDATTSASLNIIDLAGSERASATSNNGTRMKEGANINKSLLALGSCINALCQTGPKQQTHIPYRDSKLTRLLRFSLGGNCKTVMIVCVSPSSGHYEETHNTLKYANQAKNIRTKVSQNVLNIDRHVGSYVQSIHELKEEVSKLKAALAEGGPIETETEKRKKREAKAEMESVLADLRAKVQAAKISIHRESHHEATVQAAEHSSSLYRRRLDEIHGLLREWKKGRGANAEEEEPLDWTSERTFLQSLLRKDDILLQASREGARNLSSGIDLLLGQLNRAPRNSRFDAESGEQVKLIVDSLKAEIEAEREKARAAAALQSFQVQAKRCLGWLEIASRSTAIMKDFAGQLEWRVSHSDDREETAAHLKTLVESARNDIKQNDDKFRAETGNETQTRKSSYSSKINGRSTIGALRRPRASLVAGSSTMNATVAGSSSKGGLANTFRAAPLHSRRSSITLGIHRPTAASMRKARPSVLSAQSSRTAVTFSPGRSPAKPRGRQSLAISMSRPAMSVTSNVRTNLPHSQALPAKSTASSEQCAPTIPPVKGVRFQEAKEHDGKAPPVIQQLNERPSSPDLVPASTSSSDLSTEWEDVKAREPTAPRARRAELNAAPPSAASRVVPKAAGRRSLFGNNSIVPQAPLQRPTSGLTALTEDDGGLMEEDEDEEDETEKPRLRPSRGSGNFNNISVEDDGRDDKLSSAKRAGFSAPTAASRARRVGGPASEGNGAIATSSIFGDENTVLPSVPLAFNRVRDQAAPYKLRDSEIGPARRGRGSLGSVANKSTHGVGDASNGVGGSSFGSHNGLLASVRGPSMPPMGPRSSLFPGALNPSLHSNGGSSTTGGGTSMFSSGKVNSLVLPNGITSLPTSNSGRSSGGSVTSGARSSVSSSSSSATTTASSTGTSSSSSSSPFSLPSATSAKILGPPSHTASRSRLSHAPSTLSSNAAAGGGGGGVNEAGHQFGSLGRTSKFIPPPVLPPSTTR